MSHFLAIEVPEDAIRAARAGDSQAHAVIYRCCQRPVHTLIRRLIARPAVAEELFQETFVEILRGIGGYSGEGAFGGWVRSIAVNKCLMYLRSPWHRNASYLDAEEDGTTLVPALIDAASHPDVQAAASTDVERALAQLPPLTRSIVWLHDVEGFTHGEIGRMLGRTASFSKSQLSRAHQRLREVLDPRGQSESCTQVSNNC